MHSVQVPKVPKSGSNNMPNIIKKTCLKIYYYQLLFMQHFNICEAQLELARGFLGKAQAWLKLTILGSFQHYSLVFFFTTEPWLIITWFMFDLSSQSCPLYTVLNTNGSCLLISIWAVAEQKVKQLLALLYIGCFVHILTQSLVHWHYYTLIGSYELITNIYI